MADEDPTTGQRVHRELVAAASLGTDSTISAEAATPELVARGLAELAAFDPHGVTHDHSRPLPPRPDGTLDLPIGDQVASAGALDPGQIIGHFVIRRRLGEGGMGVVLAGEDPDLGRPVAIKVVKDTQQHPAYRDRLLREAKVMARLEHPNIVRVYEVGSDRGRLFVAMELVDGVTLAAWLAVERRTWRDILAIFKQVGAGLSAVHRAGLVHRDFKPDNVLVDRAGRARVADFGLARLDPDSSSDSTPALGASLTRTGMMVGTPAYMAPEQHYGGNVDARADQYSFCISLREALIGSRPRNIEDAHWGKVPRAVRAAITRGAAVDANERFPSIDALLAAISKGASRRNVWVATAAIAIVLVGGGIGAAAVLGASSDDAATAKLTTTPNHPPTTTTTPSVVIADRGSAARAEQAAPAGPPAPISPASPADTRTTSAADTRTTSAADKGAPTSAADTRTTSAADKGAPTSPADTRVPAGTSTSGTSTSGTSTSGTSSSGAGAANTVATNSGGAMKVGDTLVTPMTPVKETDAAKKHNAEGNDKRHEMIAAHRGAVRDALREFGFLGVTITGDDREADLRELEDKLAASTDDLERGVFRYAMGLTERARDNCIAANKHWAEAKKLVLGATHEKVNDPRRAQAFLFYGRAEVNEAYCALLGGRALGMPDKLQKAIGNMWNAKDPERAEVWLAWAIAQYETGEEERGKELLLQAARRGGSDKLRAAVVAYANAVGLKL